MTSIKRPAFILVIKMVTVAIGLLLIADALFLSETSYVLIDYRQYFLAVRITAVALSIPTFVVSVFRAFPGSLLWKRIDTVYHALMGSALASGAIAVLIRVLSDNESTEITRHVYIERLCGSILEFLNAVVYILASIAIFKS